VYEDIGGFARAIWNFELLYHNQLGVGLLELVKLREQEEFTIVVSIVWYVEVAKYRNRTVELRKYQINQKRIHCSLFVF
jgi:hypothetical protein